MKLEHVAIWASDLELLKNFYIRYFGGVPNDKYINDKRGFSSYFISFTNGCRLELMNVHELGEKTGGNVSSVLPGLAHIAFEVDSMAKVDAKAEQMRNDGFPILSGPRKTGDGYYEFETVDPEGNKLEVTTVYIA
jgi:lactoylglutathione lyase